MLTGVALTPQVLDPDHHPDAARWAIQLKALARRLIPPYKLQPLVVSDLYNGSWFPELTAVVAAIDGDDPSRVTAQQILTAVGRMLAKRRPCGDYPMEEDGWVKEAVASHAQLPVDLILATDAYRDAGENPAAPPVRSLSTAEAADCWACVRPPHCSPAMTLETQRDVLRPFCRRFRHVALMSPHLARPSEFDFTEMVVRLAPEPGPRDEGPCVDLHTEPDPDALPPEAVARGLRHRLKAAGAGCRRVRLLFWPRLLHRTLLVGETVTSGSAGELFRPVKGVAMEHVARRHGDADAPPAAWRLLDGRELGDRYRRCYEHGVSASAGPYLLFGNPPEGGAEPWWTDIKGASGINSHGLLIPDAPFVLLTVFAAREGPNLQPLRVWHRVTVSHMVLTAITLLMGRKRVRVHFRRRGGWE